MIREQIKLNRETGQNMDPKLLDETNQNQYNFNFKSYRVKKFYSKANTLLIVATHGLHRRSQTFEKDNYGIRNNLTISYYNEFTRFDLLKKLYN